MFDKSVAVKLQFKPDRRVLFVNAPPGYRDLLGEIPTGVLMVSTQKPVDIIVAFIAYRLQLFRSNQEEFDL